MRPLIAAAPPERNHTCRRAPFARQPRLDIDQHHLWLMDRDAFSEVLTYGHAGRLFTANRIFFLSFVIAQTPNERVRE